MSQLYPTVLLCTYGFFLNLRPLEPFLTAFLLSPGKNLSATEVVNEIYPIWTYSYLLLLFPVFLVTDYLRYKPVLILQASSLVVTYAMLWKARGTLAMQLMEFIFGLSTASDVAYYSYIYSVVDPAHYQRMTGFCRSATLFGSAAGCLVGQLLLSVAKAELLHLVFITLSSAVVAFLAPWFLPMPGRSLFFHGTQVAAEDGRRRGGKTSADRSEEEDVKIPLNGDNSQASGAPEPQNVGLIRVLKILFEDFVQCYKCRPFLAWSLWWALATCGYFQILNYAQPLWEEIRPSQDYDIYNGYVEMMSTLLGALAALLAGCLPVSWSAWGELLLCVLSSLMAVCVFVMVLLDNIWVCYVSYIIFRTIYMLLITVATYQIAASLSMQRYALVFGVNTFVALLLQSLLTLIVVDATVLGLDVSTQFLVYGVYFAVIAGIYLLAFAYNLASRRRHAPGAPMSGGTPEAYSPPPGDSI